MAVDQLFIDTWGWLVLANDGDPAFAKTTDFVLDVTMTRLFTEGIFEASGKDLLDIEHITPNGFSHAWQPRLRYRDKPALGFIPLP